MCAAPGEAQDIGYQPGGDVGVDSEPVVGESGALPEPHVGEEVASTDALGPGIDEGNMGGDSATGEGVSTTPASSAVNVEDCTPGAMEGVDYDATLDPGMQSVHHVWPIAADSMAAEDEACVEPLLGESVERVTTPKDDAQITGETERTSPDADDMGCEDNSGGKSSNIVTRMRRKPQGRKPAAVHGTYSLTQLVLAGYISAPLSAIEMELVTNVRSRFKAYALMPDSGKYMGGRVAVLFAQ
ncbi:hypothetical protein Cgig2_032848 [Carnegiea gigantea]|uniref:Uncharacterized protein n=1 Tax=Carnegiea gigantea TaxID=171969 RepID=A0A9Q1JLA1_9CARY|nr:hypothetical protein Cgig2_032848 [Carnegiea gigantea]